MSAQTKSNIFEIVHFAFEGIAWATLAVTACVFVAVI